MKDEKEAKIGVPDFVAACLEKYFASGEIVKFSVSTLPTEPNELIGNFGGKQFIQFTLKMVKAEEK